jgi:restriction system protein
MDGEDFERLCGDYFASLGYTVDFTPQSGDGGIDLVLTRDGELAVAQCKRTKKSVGEPVVRDLYGALHHTGAREAFLCSASGFSPAAESWAAGKPLTLLDGSEIVSTLRRRR